MFKLWLDTNSDIMRKFVLAALILPFMFHHSLLNHKYHCLKHSSSSSPPISPSGSITPSVVTTHHNSSVIIYPELANLLIHPDKDSFSDAPFVPGQPLSTRTILSYIDYIPSISFTYQTTSFPQYTQLINQPHQRIMDFIQTSKN